MYQNEESDIKQIHLEPDDLISEVEAADLEGEFVGSDHYSYLVQEDCDVYKPNGDLLMAFRKDVIPQQMCDDARKGLQDAARVTDNRGAAAGKVDVESLSEYVQKRITHVGKLRVDYKTSTGKRRDVANKVRSGIVGYYDSYSRIPYCRQTSYTRDHLEKYEMALPFIQEVSHNFESLIPNRYQNQKAVVDLTQDDFVIPETVFTTCTVNKNFRTAVHKDAGDLEEGFGNLTVLEKSNYEGGYTVFPKFKVAVDVRETDFLGMDVHEWHGNTEIKSENDDHERISVVCYYRKKMYECSSKEKGMEKKRKHEARLSGEENDEGILDTFLDN